MTTTSRPSASRPRRVLQVPVVAGLGAAAVDIELLALTLTCCCFLVAVRCPLRWRPMVWLTVALTTVGVGATALSATRIRTYSSQCRLIAPFPAASTAARQLDLGSQGRPFVGDYRRFDRAHPFWVMLPWPPHGTMTATTPDGKRMG